MKSLSFLIPAYNDEKTVGLQITEAAHIAATLRIPYEIIVINDASRDATGKALEKIKKKVRSLQVITHKKNIGYGATIKELYYAAKKEWLFTIPGDYQIEAKEVLKLIPFTSHTDMILGRRTDRQDTDARRLQSGAYNKIIALLFRTGTHDVNTVRLMKTTIMKNIVLRGSSAFTDAELVIKAKRAGYSIKEISIQHRNRHKGTGSGGGGKCSVIIPTIWEMLLLFFGFL